MGETEAQSGHARSSAVSAAEFWRARRGRHPRLTEALSTDAVMVARHRGEPAPAREGMRLLGELLRLAWVSDAFASQVLYRAKARLQARGIPVLPRLAHRLAMVLAQVSIGDPVVVAPGLYIVHGQVVIDGLTEIGPRVTIAPFVTIGLRAGDLQGPTIGADVSIGTGAKIIGPVTVGAGARIAAGAVVVSNVPSGATVGGVPARPLGLSEERRKP